MDPISGRPADQPPLRSLERARPGASVRPDAPAARISHRTATIVAGGVFVLTLLTLVGLWTRSGTGPALDSSTMVPSSVIAVLALAAIASTYNLGHHARPAPVPSRDLGSSPAAVRALARANAAHMAEISHIRLLDGGTGDDWAPSSRPNGGPVVWAARGGSGVSAARGGDSGVERSAS